jgi:hypothetical protein
MTNRIYYISQLEILENILQQKRCPSICRFSSLQSVRGKDNTGNEYSVEKLRTFKHSFMYLVYGHGGCSMIGFVHTLRSLHTHTLWLLRANWFEIMDSKLYILQISFSALQLFNVCTYVHIFPWREERREGFPTWSHCPIKNHRFFRCGPFPIISISLSSPKVESILFTALFIRSPCMPSDQSHNNSPLSFPFPYKCIYVLCMHASPLLHANPRIRIWIREQTEKG